MLDYHRRAVQHTVDMVELIGDDDWDRPTPCTQWTLRQLLDHMIRENRGFAAAADGEKTDRSVWLEPPTGDLRIEYARSADQVVASFGADGVREREFWLPLLTQTRMFPAPQAISFQVLDHVIHAWDVAASLGRQVPLEDDLIEVTLDIAVREVPDTPNRLNPKSTFAPALPAPAGGSGLDRLLAMLGRSPSWPS